MKTTEEMRDWLLDSLYQADMESPAFTHPEYKKGVGPTFTIHLANGQQFVVRVSEEKL